MLPVTGDRARDPTILNCRRLAGVTRTADRPLGSSLKTVPSIPILRTRPHLSWLDRAVPTCTALRQGTMK